MLSHPGDLMYVIQTTCCIDHTSSGRLTQTSLPRFLNTPFIGVIIFTARDLLHFTVVMFVWRKHENMSVHWKQGNYQLWANCFMCWNPVANAGLSVKATPPPAIMPIVLNTRHDPYFKNGLELAVWYHIPGTTMSRLCVGTILHWAAYTWHWRIYWRVLLLLGNGRVYLYASKLRNWHWTIIRISQY